MLIEDIGEVDLMDGVVVEFGALDIDTVPLGLGLGLGGRRGTGGGDDG